MKTTIQSILFVFLSGCTSPHLSAIYVPTETRGPMIERHNPALNAFQYINFSENTHRQELKELTGVDPKHTEWCAAFVNAVLDESGIQGSSSVSDYPLMARSFLDWGIPVSKKNIQPGDIVVFPRGDQDWKGHVGFYIKTQIVDGKEYYYILGGNQKNKVSLELYRSNRALDIRRQSSI